MTTEQWITHLYRAFDARDVEGYLEHLTPDVWLRFGNGEPVIGYASLRKQLTAYFSAIKAVSHQVGAIWRVGETVVVRAQSVYTRLDEHVVAVPMVAEYELHGSCAKRVAILTDVAPVFWPAAPPALCRATPASLDADASYNRVGGVEQVSIDSFPASDPPSWTGARA